MTAYIGHGVDEGAHGRRAAHLVCRGGGQEDHDGLCTHRQVDVDACVERARKREGELERLRLGCHDHGLGGWPSWVPTQVLGAQGICQMGLETCAVWSMEYGICTAQPRKAMVSE